MQCCCCIVTYYFSSSAQLVQALRFNLIAFVDVKVSGSWFQVICLKFLLALRWFLNLVVLVMSGGISDRLLQLNPMDLL